tara:strand:+ start:132 stop:455 length:324 start_codon:yes stop_codon:yes gene_type:complete
MSIDLHKEVAFREFLCNEFSDQLNSLGYQRTFYNMDLPASDDRKYIFKVVFTGPRKIEISSPDWRDYTEIFKVVIRNRELTHINVNDYETVSDAISDFKRRLTPFLK